MAISLDGLFRSLSARGIESTVLARRGLQTAGESVAATYDPKRVREAVGEASIVHLHGWFGDLALEAAAQSRRSGKPYVISPLGHLCDGPYVDRRSLRHRLRMFLRENKLLSSASAIAAMNSAERDGLIAEGVAADPVDLPYGVDFEDYVGSSESSDDTDPPMPGDRTLLILGPIHPIEGFVPFLKAFAEIGADFDGWGLVAGGADAGDCRATLEAAIRRKGGSDRARFVGADSLDSQRKLLGGSHVLACPSLHYRVAVSIMQAVAAGVAVVASDRVAPDGDWRVWWMYVPPRGTTFGKRCESHWVARTTNEPKWRERLVKSPAIFTTGRSLAIGTCNFIAVFSSVNS
ncbi:MAG: glycosyltransferase [Planctomycetes bacterium]|nr:glycosyltransferase [Planctomycetota bacterium]